MHSNMLYTILQLLQSTSYSDNLELRWESETILQNLASHSKSISVAVSEPLVALLRDNDVNSAKLGFDLLRKIAYSLAGAEGVVAANTLHYLMQGLCSPSSSVRWGACSLTGALARHESTALAILAINPCKQLMALSSTVDNDKAWIASDVLIAIANWAAGAEAAVAAQVLDHVAKWVVSRHYWNRELACRLLEKLARHKSTVQAVARAVPRELLVALLKDEYQYVRDSADNALQAIDDYLASAQASTEEAGGPTINVL
ncbi:armadillo-type protein [Mycena latifolia]|nr:armadillo-type protein [Mycena latifolia]